MVEPIYFEINKGVHV